MLFPADLKYTVEHEWIRLDGDLATVGVTDFAQDSLGDVVHVELPEPGTQVQAGEAVVEVESVKAVSDVYTPLSGEIVEVNEGLDGDEEAVNEEPYGRGWLFRIRLSDPSQLEAFMNVEAYQAFVAEQDS